MRLDEGSEEDAATRGQNMGQGLLFFSLSLRDSRPSKQDIVILSLLPGFKLQVHHLDFPQGVPTASSKNRELTLLCLTPWDSSQVTAGPTLSDHHSLALVLSKFLQGLGVFLSFSS